MTQFVVSSPVFQSTLPRGERRLHRFCGHSKSKFQSTLPRGERPLLLPDWVRQLIFQSTLPRGERHCSALSTPNRYGISIHAPARGATRFRFFRCSFFSFQSTLPRGERHTLVVHQSPFLNFNPRSREGSDCFMAWRGHPKVISIHAPARGATFFRHSGFGCMVYFNPRSREGSDVYVVRLQNHLYISIHAPARGATR